MYVSQQNVNGAITRLNFDGTEPRIIVNNLPVNVYGMAVGMLIKLCKAH